MTTTAPTHTYRYARPSELGAGRVELATSGGGAVEQPFFFQGGLRWPRLSALLLRTVGRVARANFQPRAGLLARDPVASCGAEMLRLESFSGCASTYARVDFSPESYTGIRTERGCTNVDFNAPFCAALAQVREDEALGLAVGRAEIALLRNADQFIERKVPLPARWLRAFVEVQCSQPRLEPRFHLGKVELLRFLRSLPRTTMARTSYAIEPSGRGLRLGQQQSSAGLRLAGLERLRLLDEVAPFADELRVAHDAVTGASEWTLHFGPLRLHLGLSPETWRGFSGEGQALHDLLSGEDAAAAESVRAAFAQEAQLTWPRLQLRTALEPERIRTALAALASRGLVGFDTAAQAYFHRELPFDLGKVAAAHPRLGAARALVAKGGIARRATPGGGVEADVPGSGVTHRVELGPARERCTCRWFAAHGATRGPCKHLLAVQLLNEEDVDDA